MGQIVKKIAVPKEINEKHYFSIRLCHDSILITTKFDYKTWYIDIKKEEWRLIKTVDNLIYEDKDFYVSSSCSGEFGGTIYFSDKKTGKIYEGCSTCPILINRIQNTYYITNYMGHMCGFASVLEIKNPRNLKECKSKPKYPNLSYDESASRKGITILLDTLGFYIPTSFVSKNKLYHFYSDKKGSYISFLKDKKLFIVHKFKSNFYPKFQQRLSENQQFLTFYTDNENVFGFIEIRFDKILIHYMIKK